MLGGMRHTLGLASTFVLAVVPIVMGDTNIYDELDKITPNVTRIIDTPGYNVAEKFPGSELDWELSIRLFSDVPGQVDGEDDRYISATQFFWDPPSSVPRESDGSVKVDSKFYYCISPLKYDDPEVKDGEEVDPRCSGVVSDSCLQDLQKTIDVQSWCAITSWPDSCMKHSKDNSELHMFGRVNLTETPNSLVAFPNSRDGHKKGDTKDFQSALKTVWIVMTGFAEATVGGDLVKNSDVKLKSGISCIRASSSNEAPSIGSSKISSIPTVASLVAGFFAKAIWILYM